MKFPYGLSDFYKIIDENYFYVDRTDRIWLIEETGSQLLFLRPRRFGKSLLLSMLENYYDLAKADEFERLFGHLAIGKNPTARHNQYFVMRWDFSAISPKDEPEALQQAMYDHINGCIKGCAVYYQDYLTDKVEIYPNNALASLQSLLTAIQQTPHRLYLLIDEYDNFANEIMMGSQRVSQERYSALLYGEGNLKAVFKAVKSASSGRGLDRVFITGVSPVVLSDITSGYNVATNIYLDREFNDLCGFWESEIQAALSQIAKHCGFPDSTADDALTMMRTFYNGYRFSYNADNLLYNPTLVLYFLARFQRYCEYPDDLLDSNLAMDRGKIRYISQLPGGERVILNVLDEQNPLSINRLANRFGVEDILRETKDTTFMASLLYYFGVLTLDGRTPFGELILKIPNLVVRKLYVERIQEMLLPDVNKNDEMVRAARTFYSTGDMQPLCDFIEVRFSVFDNRDYRWSNELTIKTAFLITLFNDTFYIMDSETALKRDYADMTMIVRPDMRKYQLLDILIEFKYISLKDLALSGDQLEDMSRAELQSIPLVQEKFAESKTKLNGYRQVLEDKYGDLLRLYCFSVVSLGFERLLWTQVS
jgi:hypothetical protein